jgi:hypothetical protein
MQARGRLRLAGDGTIGVHAIRKHALEQLIKVHTEQGLCQLVLHLV